MADDRLRTRSVPHVADRLADSLTFLKRRDCNGVSQLSASTNNSSDLPFCWKSTEKEKNRYGQNAGSGFR